MPEIEKYNFIKPMLKYQISQVWGPWHIEWENFHGKFEFVKELSYGKSCSGARHSPPTFFIKSL